jgi:hypothetical protein
MVDSAAAFFETLSISDCRVSQTPHLVFLCGGKVRPDAEANAPPYKSARDYFYHHARAAHPALSSRIALAETLSESFDSAFSDLLDLEEHVADLSDLIVVFVESPGSIAELGAFTAPHRYGSRKTLAVMSQAHPTSHSFIADGPIRRIKSHDAELVRYFDWSSDTLNDPSELATLEDMSRDIASFLLAREKDFRKEYQFKIDSHGHRMLLLADLVDIFGLVVESDIAEFLTVCGIAPNPKEPRKELRKYLSILKNLNIIVQWPHSSQEYYASASDQAYIRYDFLAGTKMRERDRIKAVVRSEMAAQSERWMKAYKAFRKNRERAGAARV